MYTDISFDFIDSLFVFIYFNVDFIRVKLLYFVCVDVQLISLVAG